MKARVKSWERLLEDGTLSGSDIISKGEGDAFVYEMKEYCGEVLEFVPSPYSSSNWKIEGGFWNFSNWMLEDEVQSVERLLKEYDS